MMRTGQQDSRVQNFANGLMNCGSICLPDDGRHLGMDHEAECTPQPKHLQQNDAPRLVDASPMQLNGNPTVHGNLRNAGGSRQVEHS